MNDAVTLVLAFIAGVAALWGFLALDAHLWKRRHEPHPKKKEQ